MYNESIYGVWQRYIIYVRICIAGDAAGLDAKLVKLA